MTDRTTERVEREREILAHQARERERAEREEERRDLDRALLANGKPNRNYDIERERYRGIDGIREANRDAGFHWFDPETLRFFGSRISESTFDGRYFVTSEWDGFDHAARLYSIREAMSDGQVDTVGEFQEYATRAQALAGIARLKRGG